METDHKRNWLGEDYRQCLCRIRSKVRDMWKGEKEPPLAYFTPHGPEHCQAIEDLIYMLIPGQLYEKLDEKERFFLLASAWLHDIGMIRSVYYEIFQKKDAGDFEIRDNHQITAERYIIENYHKCGLDNISEKTDHSEDRYAIAAICKYHRRREDINLCPEKLPIRNKSYRIRLLAAYLRLADALHIDFSRAPDHAYAICLAYNIPSVSKMHWIKSKLVYGVTFDRDRCSINVAFRVPTFEQLEERNISEPNWVLEKIDHIMKQVIDDLREELASVISVLAKAKISYFLEIKTEKITGYIEEQILTDLISLVTNYDILRNPSASRLIEMVLMAIANISGYYLKDRKEAKQVSNVSGIRIKKEIREFLDQIDNNIIGKRACHTGLIQLLNRCRVYCESHLPDDKDSFINKIDKLYQEHYQNKKSIRNSAKEFFENFSGKMEKQSQKDVSDLKFRILLFGYSNLVVRAICGFRDYLISLKYPKYKNDPDIEYRINSYYEAFEEEFSEQFTIFICEGQPKTDISCSNKVLYHDGFSYANELIKKNFKNIVMLPDIIAGNIMEKHDINLIIMGANGFTPTHFCHSAGHLSVIKLQKNAEKSADPLLNKVVLVVSSDKFQDQTEKVRGKEDNIPQIREINGYRFWKPSSNIKIRENVWFLCDDDTRKIADQILFYNPREDEIPFSNVDYILSDKGCYSDLPENKEKFPDSGRFFKDLKKEC